MHVTKVDVNIFYKKINSKVRMLIQTTKFIGAKTLKN